MRFITGLVEQGLRESVLRSGMAVADAFAFTDSGLINAPNGEFTIGGHHFVEGLFARLNDAFVFVDSVLSSATQG